MKTEKENSHKGTKALRKRNNYLKTSCLRDLVAKKAFTPTPICIVGEQVKNRQKQVYGQIAKSPALNKLVRGFTLLEILTVIVIIAILIGILMPALAQIKRIAKETKQKAQLGSIDVGINLYKNDFGEYPPSHGYDDSAGNSYRPADYAYCGSQTLAEAMFGQDLLGFHPDSVYRADGWRKNGTSIADDLYPDPFDPVNNAAHKSNLDSRKDAYLDRTNISVFMPRRIFNKDTSSGFLKLEPDRYVICDVFTAVSRKIKIGGMEKTYKIGTPVLYFRANPSAENPQLIPHNDPLELVKNIYNWSDNSHLISLGTIIDGKPHSLWTVNGERFYGFIGDPMISNLTRPVRLDSFLLISAGSDGLYGTKDDICNFEPNSI
jgi:prepilin-type N-terminal cleavage/methylation domain-containing protein